LDNNAPSSAPPRPLRDDYYIVSSSKLRISLDKRSLPHYYVSIRRNTYNGAGNGVKIAPQAPTGDRI